MKVNIKDIAKLANVSPTTISRVVNNSGYVKADVRERVEKIIEETGYRPNAFAKALLQNKSHTIGVVLSKINSSSSGDTVAGIDEFISPKGYTIIIGNTNYNVEKELEYFNIFQEKMVDGIILMGTEITKKHKEFFKKSKIPLVILAQESLDSIPCVVFDDYMATKELCEHLISQERKKIAYIGVGEFDIAVGKKRKEGFLSALKENNMSIPTTYIVNGDFTVDSGYKACKKIFSENTDRPDAILAVTDKMAIGAMSYLFELGIKVPEEVAVVGMGGGMLAKYFHPKLTSAEYDYTNLGYEGAKLLYDIINEDRESTKKIILNHKLRIRESS